PGDGRFFAASARTLPSPHRPLVPWRWAGSMTDEGVTSAGVLPRQAQRRESRQLEGASATKRVEVAVKPVVCNLRSISASMLRRSCSEYRRAGTLLESSPSAG